MSRNSFLGTPSWPVHYPTSSKVGVIPTFAFHDRVTAGLRQGKSKVLEQGHTLILGWNDRLLGLLEQMCEANSSEGGMPIVVLANRDKEEMDDWMMDAFDDEARMGSKIVTRKGNPIEASKLAKVSAEHARSIIVLSEGEDPDEADAWWDLVDRCQQRNMLPLGWIRKGGDNRNEYEVELNPANKDEQIRFLGKDSPDGDLLVVILED